MTKIGPPCSFEGLLRRAEKANVSPFGGVSPTREREEGEEEEKERDEVDFW